MASITRGRRVLLIALLNIALMTPPVVLSISGQLGLASAFVYGGVIAIGAVFYDLRLAVLLSVVAGVAGSAAALLNPYPVAGAVFFGALTGACALSARRGLHSPVLMVPIFLSFLLAAPPAVPGLTPTPAALVAGVALALGGLWATASARLLLGRPRGQVDRTPLSLRVTVIYAVLMGLVVGVATWVVLVDARYHQGAWLLLTLIVVLQPSPHDTFIKSLQRLAGTIVGGAAALVLILLGVQSTLALLVGGVVLYVALVVRYVLKRPYWEYIAVLTPAVILLNAPGADAVRIAEDRIVFTVIATVIGLGLALAAKAVITRGAPEEDSA